MMRQPIVAALLAIATLSAYGQSTAPTEGSTPAANALRPQEDSAAPAGISTLRARTSLVLVPALVTTRQGEPVFTLTADDFTLTDNGVPQTARLEENADQQPLALVILVESGGAGVQHLAEIRGLQTALENVIGDVQHSVAVVDFDSRPELLLPFTTNMDKVGGALAQLDGGDEGVGMLDALQFATDQLLKKPPQYRRAILMLGETHDRGSRTTVEDVVRAVTDNNIIIYSFAFSSTRADVRRAAGALPPQLGGTSEPNPAGGCFSRKPDADGNKPTKSVAEQDFDCLSQLAPPLALARMAFVAAVSGMREDVPETVARLTGGEYFRFKDTKTLQADLHVLSNHVANRYLLSFTPREPVPGFHTLVLSLKARPGLKVDARTGYWALEKPKPY